MLKKKRNVKLEDKIQKHLVKWVRMYKFKACFLYIKNEEWCGVIKGAHNKAMGKLPGVTDFFLAIASQGFHGFWIELKRPKSPGRAAGVVSENQLVFMTNMQSQGYKTGVFYSWHSAAQAIIDYLELPIKL